MTDDSQRIKVTLDPMLEPIFPRYMEIRGREQEQMALALDEGDLDTVKLLGHRIKGSGTAYGLPAVTEFGAGIELAAEQGDADRARMQVEALTDYMARLSVSFGPQGEGE